MVVKCKIIFTFVNVKVIKYKKLTFLAPKGAYEVQMLSLRASVCPSVRLIMLYSSSKGFLRVPKSS